MHENSIVSVLRAEKGTKHHDNPLLSKLIGIAEKLLRFLWTFGLIFASFKSRFTRHRGHGGRFFTIQSGLRRAVAASAAQAGDGDWIVNPVPSGIESAQPQLALVQKKFSALKKQKAFYWAGTSSENDSEPSARQIKKLLLCALCDSVVTNLFWTRVMTTIKKRCPFCHTEMEIPRSIGEQGYCQCGAYGLITLLSEAGSFFQRARKALGVDPAQTGRFMEMVDGGIVFEEKGEPVLIQWAKKPNTSH